MPDFTICVLLYGDHLALVQRCLQSILSRLPRDQYELRIGMNEVCSDTRQYVDDVFTVRAGGTCDTISYVSLVNRHKYPMLRRMLNDPSHPLATPYVMHFDDDSFLIGRYENWLGVVRERMTTATMLGAIYKASLCGNQHLWIQDQLWYTGKPVKPRQRITFCTGGWWTIRTEVLQKHDWPSPELDHRGGDVMLGELCRQQDYSMQNFREGVAINADAEGHESKALRRGFDAVPDPRHLIGYEYDPGAPPPGPTDSVPGPRRQLELDL